MVSETIDYSAPGPARKNQSSPAPLISSAVFYCGAPLTGIGLIGYLPSFASYGASDGTP
jgi:hypothetical protein